ncbi:MAG TPA: SAM-dependent methyltransferase, partial [Bacteroidia bacterium]
MKSLYFIIKSIRYFFASKNAHGIHSPFVFELYNEVICKKNNYYVFDRIEQQRQKLLVSTKSIDVTDLGTGKSGKKNIAGIAGRSLKSKKYGQLLFRLVNRFKPETIVELGTSLGITAAYLASANPKAKIVTIEGCPNISNEA